MYEMAAGRDFRKDNTYLIPSEEDYSYVQDEGCREILQYIFTLDVNGDILHTIKQVRILRLYDVLSKTDISLDQRKEVFYIYEA